MLSIIQACVSKRFVRVIISRQISHENSTALTSNISVIKSLQLNGDKNWLNLVVIFMLPTSMNRRSRTNST
jgi:hypothetical protein